MKKMVFAVVLVGVLGLPALANITLDVYAYNNSLSNAPLATGIFLNAGDILTVSVAEDDTWSAGSGTRISNADGLGPDNAYGGNYGMYMDPVSGASFYFGSLVGQIGSGDYFFIGTSYSGVVSDSGELKMLYWDSNYSDNSGSVEAVTAKISSSVSVPAPGALLLGGMGTGLVGWLRRRRTL